MGKVIAGRALTPANFARVGEYQLFELPFANPAPAGIEFRVHALRRGFLSASLTDYLLRLDRIEVKEAPSR